MQTHPNSSIQYVYAGMAGNQSWFADHTGLLNRMSPSSVVRVVFRMGNELLLQALLERNVSIQVCGANVLWNRRVISERDECNLIMSDAVSQRPKACGGWRDFSQTDLIAHQVRMAYFNGNMRQSVADASNHPLWKYCAYLTKFDPESLAVIIAMMVDPRDHVWYHFPSKSRLLHPSDSSAPFVSALVKGISSNWSTVQGVLVDAANRVWDSQLRTSGVGRYFQDYYSSRTLVHAEAHDRGDPKGASLNPKKDTTRRFAQYLRECWMDSLSLLPGGQRWFDPFRFFADDPESAKVFNVRVCDRNR